jgi:peptidase E
MNGPLQPIYLLADSQLLFRIDNDRRFLNSVRDSIERENPRAAYVGASNGDNPDYYSIFESAMEGIGISNCRMISSSPLGEDISFIAEADLILLAGGDVEQGWRIMEKNGMKEIIFKRYYEGALLMGVSAGAVQLGWCGWSSSERATGNLIDTFKLVPFIVGVHEEGEEWQSLQDSLRATGGSVQGIGIPAGGAIIYHTDQSIEPVLYPVYGFELEEDHIKRHLIIPSGTGDVGVLEAPGGY